jgi:hypothetical protein
MGRRELTIVPCSPRLGFRKNCAAMSLSCILDMASVLYVVLLAAATE